MVQVHSKGAVVKKTSANQLPPGSRCSFFQPKIPALPQSVSSHLGLVIALHVDLPVVGVETLALADAASPRMSRRPQHRGAKFSPQSRLHRRWSWKSWATHQPGAPLQIPRHPGATILAPPVLAAPHRQLKCNGDAERPEEENPARGKAAPPKDPAAACIAAMKGKLSLNCLLLFWIRTRNPVWILTIQKKPES